MIELTDEILDKVAAGIMADLNVETNKVAYHGDVHAVNGVAREVNAAAGAKH